LIKKTQKFTEFDISGAAIDAKQIML